MSAFALKYALIALAILVVAAGVWWAMKRPNRSKRAPSRVRMPIFVPLAGWAGLMNKSNVWTIVGVVVAVIVAWFVVSALFSVLWFIAKLALVAVVAVVVYLVLRGAFSKQE